MCLQRAQHPGYGCAVLPRAGLDIGFIWSRTSILIRDALLDVVRVEDWLET